MTLNLAPTLALTLTLEQARREAAAALEGCEGARRGAEAAGREAAAARAERH